MAALYHRRKTGRGQFIDLSQAENVMHTLSQAVMDYSMNGRVQSSLGNRHPYRAPQGVYRCAGDDSWIALSVGDDDAVPGPVRGDGQPGAGAGRALRGPRSRRQAHHDELDADNRSVDGGQGALRRVPRAAGERACRPARC